MSILKCPHCGRVVGETVTGDVSLQTNKPLTTRKTKAVIDKTCPRCKEHMFMIVAEQNKQA